MHIVGQDGTGRSSHGGQSHSQPYPVSVIERGQQRGIQQNRLCRQRDPHAEVELNCSSQGGVRNGRRLQRPQAAKRDSLIEEVQLGRLGKHLVQREIEKQRVGDRVVDRVQ